MNTEAIATALRAIAEADRAVRALAAPQGPAAPAAHPPPPPAAAPSYPQRPPQRGEEVLAPFGRHKGEPLSAIDAKDLEFLKGALEKSCADPSKQMYRAKNERDLQAVNAELRSRFL